MNEYLSKEYIIKLLDAHLVDSSGAEHYAYDIIKREIMAAPGTKRGHWIYWGGWCGNHDKRIDDAVCSECGYEHRTVRYEKGDYHNFVPFKLADKCPGCGAVMDKVMRDD